MSTAINTIPIQQFINQVKSAELSNQKEIRIDIKTAKVLAFCLGEVSAKLVEDYDKVLSSFKSQQGTNDIKISMDGGGFIE